MADFTVMFGGQEHFLWPTDRKRVMRSRCPCCGSEHWDEVIELIPMSEWSAELQREYEAFRRHKDAAAIDPDQQGSQESNPA